MFDLEKAITDWRRQMIAVGLKKVEALDELESHLRDEMERQMQAGLTTRQAFENGIESIGSGHALKNEFGKVSGPSSKFLQAVKSFILGRRPAPLLSLTDFTTSAQQTLEFARAEAPRLNHDFIGTEHVLLGLLNSPSDIVSSVMRRLALQSDAVRSEINTLIGPGVPGERVVAAIPYTPRARRALALALGEAKALHQSQVNPEHIFLGLIKEGEGVAAMVLRNLGVDVNRTREEIMNEMGLPKRTS